MKLSKEDCAMATDIAAWFNTDDEELRFGQMDYMAGLIKRLGIRRLESITLMDLGTPLVNEND